MHADAFDRFHEADSRLHRLDPRVKVVVTILFILSNALLPDGAWPAFGLSWLVLLWANHLSSLGVDFSFRRSFIALPYRLRISGFLMVITIKLAREPSTLRHPIRSIRPLASPLTLIGCASATTSSNPAASTKTRQPSTG